MRVRALLKACPLGILLAGPMLPVAAAHAESPSCAAPAIEVAAKPGGQRQFTITSPCRKGELVIGRYGEVVIMERLDPGGNLAFQLDCFLGDLEIVLTFADNRRASNHACAAAEKMLTKVAIVWQDSVNLDLHALEYAALPGSAYDRSERNPGSFQTAQSEYVQAGRSFGFMSKVSDGKQLGHNVEVYTLLRHPAEPRGLIAIAVALGTNGDASACGSRRAPLRVDVDVYVLEQGSRLRSYERTFAGAVVRQRPPGFFAVHRGSEGRPDTGFIDQELEWGSGKQTARTADALAARKLKSAAGDPFVALLRDVQETSRISTTLRFRYNSIELDNKALRDVDVLVPFLEFVRQTRPDRRLLLAGFSDTAGTVDRNVALSLERANAVKQALLRKLKDPQYARLIDVRGYGPAMPVACNETEAGLDKNRRVEVWLR